MRIAGRRFGILEQARPKVASPIVAVLVGCLALGTQPAFGVAQFDPPEAELALLPPYCATVAGAAGYRSMGPEAKKWLQILGPEYYHIHHYCDAIWQWNVAQRTFGKPRERATTLKRALGGIEYVQSRARPDFVLNGEMAYLKGRILSAMGQEQAAVASFRQATKFQPAYTPPYAALADHYESAGNIEEAKKVLMEGLEAAPGAKQLQKRLDQMKAPKS